jgi:hypothetical protein
MYDLDNKYNHGGGTVANDGSNFIPEGALENYEGPTPSYGSTRYEISVKAVGDNGKVIGFGKIIKEYSLKPL